MAFLPVIIAAIPVAILNPKRDKRDARNPLFIYTSYTCHTCHTVTLGL